MGRYQVGVALTVVIILRASPANAFCISPGPPSEEFSKASAVFHGTVVTVHDPVLPWSPSNPGSRITIRVEESFKGASSNLVDVFAWESGDGPHFVVGRHYFVYANLHPLHGRLNVLCEREKLFEQAAEDLEYARYALSDCAPSEIFGRIMHWDPSGRTAKEIEKTLSNVYVVLRSDDGNEWTTRSSEDGRYVFAGLTAGHYTIEIAVPDRMYGIGSIGPLPLEVNVARVCRSVDFMLQWDGRIRGRVVTAGGNPVSAFVVGVQQQPEKPWYVRYPAISARTDDGGYFEVMHLPAGDYQLGFDLRQGPVHEIQIRDGSPTLGATLGEGERLALPDLMLPAEMIVGELFGTVVAPNGYPIEGASIYVRDNGDAPTVSLKTDLAGTFNARVIQGHRYRVRAESQSTGRIIRASRSIDITGSTTVLWLNLTASPSK